MPADVTTGLPSRRSSPRRTGCTHRCRLPPFLMPPRAPSAPRTCASHTAGAGTARRRSALLVGRLTSACQRARRLVATRDCASVWCVAAPLCRTPGGCGSRSPGSGASGPERQSSRKAKKTGSASKSKADSANITRESSSTESIAQHVLNWTVPPGKSSLAWNWSSGTTPQVASYAV